MKYSKNDIVQFIDRTDKDINSKNEIFGEIVDCYEKTKEYSILVRNKFGPRKEKLVKEEDVLGY